MATFSTLKRQSLFCLLVFSIFTACEKEGPSGPEGEKGEQGIQGIQGISGLNGASILSGTGAPVATIGTNGDFYLDKSTNDLYGPKASGVWGNPTSLKGEQGAPGANGANGTNGNDGSKILSGSGAPGITLGVVGDFYFDTNNIAFYGPKTATSWGSPVSLKAPEANGVKIVLYKDQAFQKVSKDLDREKSYQAKLDILKGQIETQEASIESAKQNYNQSASSLLEALKNNQVTQQQYDDLLIQAKSSRDQLINAYEPQVAEAKKEKAVVEGYLAAGAFDLESTYIIDTKYRDYYDNGIITVYIRKSGEANAWEIEDINLIEDNELQTYLSAEIRSIKKDNILITGYSEKLPEADVRAAKFDLKIVFIPASSVEVMSSLKVNVHNATAVANFLRF